VDDASTRTTADGTVHGSVVPPAADSIISRNADDSADHVATADTIDASVSPGDSISPIAADDSVADGSVTRITVGDTVDDANNRPTVTGTITLIAAPNGAESVPITRIGLRPPSSSKPPSN
jgi:hypothetical protein